MTKKIFYSWQSDDETSKKLLDNAIKIIKDKRKDFIITEATKDESGSPNISNKIIEKIEEADVFIGDISIIGTIEKKYYPNSNVLYELGYATKVLGEENCIMFFNISKYKIEDLPFDIKQRRTSIITSKKNFCKDIIEFIDACNPKENKYKLKCKLDKFIESVFFYEFCKSSGGGEASWDYFKSEVNKYNVNNKNCNKVLSIIGMSYESAIIDKLIISRRLYSCINHCPDCYKMLDHIL